MTAPSADDLLAHTDWLLQLARALVGDAHAPDVVQETFTVAITKPPKESGPLRPWLGGVARNLAKMSLRGRARREQREQSVPVVSEVPSSLELVERARMQQKVAAIVLELPEALRDVLLLRFFEGMSAAEIARAQGIPGATVRSRLADALARVREALDAHHGGNRRAWIALVAPLPMAMPIGHGVAAGGLLVSTGLKLVIAAVVVAIAAIATYVFVLREPAAPRTAPVATKNAPPPVVTPPTPVAAASPVRGPELAHDDDPPGSIRLEGQVIDDKDQPVGGAQVAIDAHPPKQVISEADGSFVIDGLLARDYRIEASGASHYAGPVRLRLTANPEPITLRMREAGVVEVVVTSSDGAAIAGATVELRSTLTWTATSDARGIATLRGVGAAWAPLVARAQGYAQSAIMLHTSGSPAAPARVSLVLAKGAAIAGRVRTETGAPVAGARVVATAASEPFPLVDPRRDGVVTKADGTFSLPTVASGTWRITATHGEHAPTTSAPITVDGAHAKTGVELVLAAGATLSGVVRDAAGAPVATADVRVVVRGTTLWRAQRTAVTGSDGAFSITGLPRRPVDVVAASALGSSAITSVDLAATPRSEVALQLDVTGVIAGIVVDSAGQPIGDAQILAEPAASGGVDALQTWVVRGEQLAVSDQGGAFTLAGLPSGTYEVSAARPGAASSALALAAHTTVIVGSQPGDKLRLVLAADGTITGKVALADGSTPAAFSVAIGDTYPVPFATPDGTFSLPAVVGTHTLVVDGRRFLAAKATKVTVKAGAATDVGTITVQPGRSVSGRVLDDNRMPVVGAKVAAGTLLTGGGAELYIPDESIGAKDAVTDENGRFVIEGFPPTQVTIVAGKDSARSSSVRLPASPDSASVELVLGKTAGLEGTITRDGKPLPDTIVIANPIGANASNFFVQTGPDGTFVLDALAPGPYVVYPMIGGGGPRPKDMFVQRVEVAPAGRTKVTIDASPGPTTVTVQVKTDAGAAAPMAMVFLISATVSVQTPEQLRDLDQIAMTDDKPLPIYMRAALGGPAEIVGVRGGAATVCAMTKPGDPTTPANVACVPAKIAGAAQTVTVTVPASWYQ